MLVSVTPATFAQPFSPAVEEAYARHKRDVLTKFTDEFGLVVNLDKSKPADIGDAAWRTGLAALCFAIEKDQENTRRYLTALRDKCWRDGKPIRHPNSTETGSKAYSRDQFIPQMAACFFAHEFGDDQTKALAKDLYKRFIDRIREDDWRLNEGEAAKIDPANRFAFFETADRLGLVEGPKLKRAGGPGPRTAFILAMKAKSIELANPTAVAAVNEGNAAFQFYGVHLMFLEALITIKCRPQTDGLIAAAHDVGHQAGDKHNMGPFLWLRGDLDKARGFLEHWPTEWDHCSYVWQRSKKQQEDAAKRGRGREEYARLDFMLL